MRLLVASGLVPLLIVNAWCPSRYEPDEVLREQEPCDVR